MQSGLLKATTRSSILVKTFRSSAFLVRHRTFSCKKCLGLTRVMRYTDDVGEGRSLYLERRGHPKQVYGKNVIMDLICKNCYQRFESSVTIVMTKALINRSSTIVIIVAIIIINHHHHYESSLVNIVIYHQVINEAISSSISISNLFINVPILSQCYSFSLLTCQIYAIYVISFKHLFEGKNSFKLPPPLLHREI